MQNIYDVLLKYIDMRSKKKNIKKKWYMGQYKQENQSNFTNYPQDFLEHISMCGYKLECIQEVIGPKEEQYIISIFEKIHAGKDKVRKKIISYRFAENANGKLNRIVYEKLLKEFGLADYANTEQINFAVDYLMDNLSEIILSDIRDGMYEGREPFMYDRPMVELMIKEFLEQWKATLILKNVLSENIPSRYIKKLPPN